MLNQLLIFGGDGIYLCRGTKLKLVRNIFVVWSLTGLWHGASWNFILWGIYFGIILIIEKMCLKNFLERHSVLAHIYTFFLIIISFVIFNITDIKSLGIFFKSMFGFNNLPFTNFETIYYLKSYLLMLIISLICATPIVKYIKNSKLKRLIIVEPIVYIGLLFIATAYLVDSTFNPFIYFRF